MLATIWQLFGNSCRKEGMNNGQQKTLAQSTLDGILVIDKPMDWTSHDIVAKVRKICATKRVGHTGTLDPFATGVLVICLNRATRLVQFLTGEEKEYLATIRFGFATDTGDFTGLPLSPTQSATHLNKSLIEDALTSFRGNLLQTPPMYSAKKIGGQKLYELARRGENIERKPIEVKIKELELLPAQDENFELCAIRVVCSAGTYIRTLAEDIGKKLGIGAHLASLRRTRVGTRTLNQSLTLDQLQNLTLAGNLSNCLIPMSEALSMPEVIVDAQARQFIAHGRALESPENLPSNTLVKIIFAQTLIAIASYDAGSQTLQPRIVLI